MTLAMALAGRGRVLPPPEDDSLLLAIALVLLVGALLAAALLTRRAPAVSFALVGAVVVGSCGFLISSADGPHWVPQEVSAWASLGVGVGGLVGLIVTRVHRADRRFLWVGGTAALIIAPGLALALGLALAEACPLYSELLKGYCYYGGDDLLGAWVSGVAILFFLDMVALSALFFISAWRAG
jgi:hypothetical protein